MYSPIEEIIQEMSVGRMIILVDHEDRENEADFVIAAQFITAENINFMIKEGRGLVCLAIAGEIANRLEIELQPRRNITLDGTKFTTSIDAKDGISTGISTSDRAITIKTAISPQSTGADIQTPGHIFPLIAETAGVLARPGHTEASVDLAKLANCIPAAVICEILTDDGQMARQQDLFSVAARHKLKIGKIADLIAFRSKL